MKSFVWGREVLVQLLICVRRSPDAECCGFLLGQLMGDATIVGQIVSVRNVEASLSSFAIADYERIRVEQIAKHLGLQVVAIFHTHPSGRLELSQEDKISIEYSDLPWVVVSLQTKSDAQLLQLALYEEGTGLRFQSLSYQLF